MDTDFWFSKKSKKFCKNIDTLYYSVTLENDFTIDSQDLLVQNVRKYIEGFKGATDGQTVLIDDFKTKYQELGFDTKRVLCFRHGVYARMYTFRLECPDFFDFFFAPYVPPVEGDSTGTPQICVQIRSRALWELGPVLAYKDSFSFVETFCKSFRLTIKEVKENRCDFACHTNYLQDPNAFFEDKHFHNVAIHSFSRSNKSTAHYRYYYENDYISLGKRGDKCFVRIYYKSKEVVEQGYKGFFLKYWALQGLISRYDLYCLESAYKMRKWLYVDVARLLFCLENMEDLPEETKKRIIMLTDPSKPYDYVEIKKLADLLVPPVTIIINIEFQVMRQMSKSFQLIHYAKNNGIDFRIYDYLDNYKLIYEYLTRKTLRICSPDPTKDKYDWEYSEFWKRLRSAKNIDMKTPAKDLKLIRSYQSTLDMQVRKKRAIHAVSSFAYCLTHDTKQDFHADCWDMLSLLNDSDLRDIHFYKEKLAKRETNDIVITDDTIVLPFSDYHAF